MNADALDLPRGWRDSKYALLAQAFVGEFVQGEFFGGERDWKADARVAF